MTKKIIVPIKPVFKNLLINLSGCEIDPIESTRIVDKFNKEDLVRIESVHILLDGNSVDLSTDAPKVLALIDAIEEIFESMVLVMVTDADGNVSSYDPQRLPRPLRASVDCDKRDEIYVIHYVLATTALINNSFDYNEFILTGLTTELKKCAEVVNGSTLSRSARSYILSIIDKLDGMYSSYDRRDESPRYRHETHRRAGAERRATRGYARRG